MNDSQESPSPDTRILEFAEIIAPKDGSASPVVVGGHAVNLWSEHYLAAGVKALAAYMPFTSKDLDLVGPVGLLEQLHRSHPGTLSRSEPRSPVLGRLDLQRKNGGLLRIEVLHMVKGLDAKDLARAMELKIDGVAAMVLLPHIILKAKIENTDSILQEGRNDVKHVHMMILCVRAFIEEFAGYVSTGHLSERAMVNLLEETFEIITSERAHRSSVRWEFDFSKVWPFEVLGGLREGKVSRWLQHRFPSGAA
jgi:hypothetical protein